LHVHGRFSSSARPIGRVPSSLTVEEWERLKEAYVDAAIDAGDTLSALVVRVRVLEGSEGEAFRERIRRIREVVELAADDWASRWTPFERELERVRPPGGSPIHPRRDEP